MYTTSTHAAVRFQVYYSSFAIIQGELVKASNRHEAHKVTGIDIITYDSIIDYSAVYGGTGTGISSRAVCYWLL